MTKYAKIVNDVVVDVLDDLATQVHPSLHGDYTTVPDGTEIGFVKNGEQYEAPVVEEVAIKEAPLSAPSISKLDFLRRFTRAERITLRGAVTTDPFVADFMHLLDLASVVELTDAELIEALAYLEEKSLLAAGRKDEILDGPTTATPAT
jgi:hypothetical protein